jgi:hypothetical protein
MIMDLLVHRVAQKPSLCVGAPKEGEWDCRPHLAEVLAQEEIGLDLFAHVAAVLKLEVLSEDPSWKQGCCYYVHSAGEECNS